MDYLLNICLLAVIYILFFRKRWKENPAHSLELNFIMYLYVGLVLMVTLMPFATPFGEIRDSISHTINLIPFRDLSLGYRGAEREILLNVVMMIPFGFRALISSRLIVYGCTSQYTLHSLTLLAMSWVVCEPKSRIIIFSCI